MNLAANGIAERFEVYGILSAKDFDDMEKENADPNANPIAGESATSESAESKSDKQLPPGLIALCETLALRNIGLSTLDLRANHIGNEASALISDMLQTRKQGMSTTKASPLVAHVSERISEELFNKILELNDAMTNLGKKGGKGGKKKK